MRILTINNTADLYGASRCHERLFARFIQDGHDVFAVLPTNGPLRRQLEAKGVKVLIHPSLSLIERASLISLPGKLRLLVGLPFSTLTLAFFILRYRIDIVHTNTATIVSPALAAAITRRPHIWHIREFFSEFPFLWRFFQRYIVASSQTVIAISSAVKNQFAPALAHRVTVVYDGLPISEYQPVSESDRHAWRARFDLGASPTVAVVGRIKWLRKGQEVLVRAAALLRPQHPTAKYLVVGTPAPGNEEHLDKLKRLIAELDLSSAFVFTGDLADPRPAFAAVDVTVVPSVQPEPFGCVVMESMALQTPVVGSNAAGIAEQIVHQKTGFLFEPGSEMDLAAALDRLFSDPELRRDMAAAGRKRFLDKFDLERSYQLFLSLFQDAVNPESRVCKRPLADLPPIQATEDRLIHQIVIQGVDK